MVFIDRAVTMPTPIKKKRETIRIKCGDKCYYCLTVFTDWKGFGIDHVLPRSKGGTNAYDNLVLACNKCNNVKSNYLIEDLKKILQILFESEQRELRHITKMIERLKQI